MLASSDTIDTGDNLYKNLYSVAKNSKQGHVVGHGMPN